MRCSGELQSINEMLQRNIEYCGAVCKNRNR